MSSDDVKKRNITKDILSTFVTKVIYLGGSFFVSVILARLLGADGKGMITSLFVMPNILISLADMGVRQSSAYLIGQKKYPLQKIFSSSLLLWAASSTLSIIFLLIYYFLPITTNYHWVLILLATFSVPIKILDTYYYGFHQGKQQIEAMNKRHIIEFLTKLVCVVIFVGIMNMGVFGATLSTIGAMIMVGIYSYNLLKSIVRFRFKYYSSIAQELFTKGISFALALFVLRMNYRIDILILEQFTSAREVGIYSVGVGLAELIWQLPIAIGTVLFASSANSQTDSEASTRATQLLRVSLVFLFFGGLLFSLTSHWIVPFIYGSEFQASSRVINILLPGILFMIIVQVLHSSLSGRGYPLIGIRLFIGSVILNSLLNGVFIPIYDINGAAIASTISYTVSGIGYAYLYSKKEDIKLKEILVMNKKDIELIKKQILNLLKIK